MKTIYQKIKKFSMLASAALLSLPMLAQTVLPENSLPMIIVPHSQAISYQERVLSYEIPSNIPFEIKSTVDWIQVRKGTDNIYYFHVDRTWGNEDRTGEVIFTNKEKGIMEILHITQGFDPNINEKDYKMLMDKIKDTYIRKVTVEDVEKAMAVYNPKDDGSFTDVNYASSSRVQWPPMEHINKLVRFAEAYVDPSHKYYGDEKLHHMVTKGLEFWIHRNPYCTNWWYNEIGEPQQLGLLMIYMRYGKKPVPANVEQMVFDHMIKECGYPGRGSGATGVNRTDVATHWLYRGVLSKNEEVTRIGLDNIFIPVCYTTGEGFQHDNSYCQHGHQLYISGYGEVMLHNMSKFCNIIAGSKFKLSQDKLDIITRFALQTYFGVIRGGHMAWDVLGRGIGNANCTKKNLDDLAQRMISIDPEHKQEYQDAADRAAGRQPADYNIKPRNTYYYRGEYALHIRPKFNFSVRTVSHRSHRNEWGDGANFQGYFVSEGGTCIMRSGNEYDNIWNVWNWTQLPGITAPQMPAIPQDPSYMTLGFGNYAGGVSDSLYGASAFAYYDNYADNKYRHTPAVNTGANKSWFFFDDEVVCLGSVTSQSEFPVKSTVNQCLLHDADVWMNDGKTTSKVAYGSELKHIQPEWILHDKVGYVFPQGGDIWLNNHEQTGDSRNVHAGAAVLDTMGIFSCGFDYAPQPTKVPYAYIVVPTVETVDDMTAYQQRKAIQIVKNEDQLQSVYHKGLKIWQTVFFSAGAIELNGMKLSVNRGCIVMIKPLKEGHYELHIADPTYSRQSVTATIEHEGQPKQTITAKFSSLPNYEAGKSLVFYFK